MESRMKDKNIGRLRTVGVQNGQKEVMRGFVEEESAHVDGTVMQEF